MRRIVIIISFIILCASFSGCSMERVDKVVGKVPAALMFASEGAQVGEDGTIYIGTSIEDNKYNFVALQLRMDDEKQGFFFNITTSWDGKNSVRYKHELDTDTYIIRLKGNSNIKDEGVDLRVALIQGESYLFSYNVTKLEEKSIVIKDFSIRYAFRQ